MTEDEKLFQENLPRFTDMEAANLWGQYGRIISLAGRDGPLPGTYLGSGPIKVLAEMSGC